MNNKTSAGLGSDGTDYLASVLSLTIPISDRIQLLFDWYQGFFGKSPYAFDIFGAMCLTMGAFWSIGLLYTALDLLKWPQFLYKYKTQDKEVTGCE